MDKWESNGVTLYHGDAFDIIPTLSGIDAIITDPPYPKKFQYLWSVLGSPAYKVCKPDAFLGTLVGHYQMPFVMDVIQQAGWEWLWLCVLPGGHSPYIFKCKTKATFKPFLLYRKGSIQPTRTIRDNFQIGYDVTSRRDAKAVHPWGQAVTLFWEPVDALCPVGGLILDPFMGSGTTGEACVRLGRKFIGIEIEKKYFDASVKRIQNLIV